MKLLLMCAVWNASYKWPWVDNAQCASTLQSAVSLYRDNDELKTEKAERHRLTECLFNRIEQVLISTTQLPESHRTSASSDSRHSEPKQTRITASLPDAVDIGASTSATQSDPTVDKLAEPLHADLHRHIPSPESMAHDVPHHSEGAGI